MYKILIALALSTLLISCGTDTGNPGVVQSNDGFDQSGGLATHSTMVVTSVCKILVSCNAGLTKEICTVEVNAREDMVSTLGLSKEEFATLEEVKKAEMDKSLNTNQDKAKICLVDIQSLACVDEQVVNAFDLESDQPFSNVETIVPEICLKSYTL